MARQVIQTIVGGELLGFTDGGVVEDLNDEFVDGQTVIETHPADVKEFRGGFADLADTRSRAQAKEGGGHLDCG